MADRPFPAGGVRDDGVRPDDDAFVEASGNHCRSFEPLRGDPRHVVVTSLGRSPACGLPRDESTTAETMAAARARVSELLLTQPLKLQNRGSDTVDFRPGVATLIELV